MSFCETRDGVPVESGGGAPAFTTLYNAVYESGSFSTSSASYVQITGSTLTLPGAANQIYIFNWQVEVLESDSSFEQSLVRCQDITTPLTIGNGMGVNEPDTPEWDIRSGFKQFQLSANTTFQIQCLLFSGFGPVEFRRARMWALLIG